MTLNHIDLLVGLNVELLQLDRLERSISAARYASMNQHFQLMLDRHQADTEKKRAEILQVMAEMRNNN